MDDGVRALLGLGQGKGRSRASGLHSGEGTAKAEFRAVQTLSLAKIMILLIPVCN
jgi:hypothetical protein